MTHKSMFRTMNIALIALSALLVIGIFSFAGPCNHDDGTLATCFNAGMGIAGAGVFIVGIALFGLMDVTPMVRVVLGIGAALLGLFIAFAPGNIMPLCMMETMQCHAVMQPFAMLVGIACVLVGAAMAIVAFRIR